ncbi:MAG: efflux RND transporter permease subunit [Deltaproteobacteria bacterium]|nr:efflux RND transporter permease subunit [Deltaproteobacteria bacterium]
MKRGISLLVLCAVVAGSVLGLVLARSIPSAVFPQLQFNRAIILAESGDLPSAQMLVSVTRPLEEAAYGAMNVSQVRSTTTRGSSEIDVTFVEGSDPVASSQLLNNALSEVEARLPSGTNVQSRLLTSGTFPILDISMNSRDRSLVELTDIAQYDLVPTLHRIPGVYRVEAVGAKYREFNVWLDPARMLQHGVGANDVITGLANANVIESAGRIMDKHRMLLTVMTADVHDADQLAALAVAKVGGQPVYVRDLARVELGIVEDYIRTSCENGPAVLVNVSQEPGGNTVEISAEAHSIMEQFRGRYPDVRFSLSYDQAALVSESFRSVRDAIILGLLLSVAVVFLFTWSVVSALAAGIIVPCTIAITFVVMKAAGTTFNMMSLGGLAAGIGLFIDDAIVMLEAIHRSHERGARGQDSVNAALQELTRPLIASTSTVVVVFAPLVLLSGVTGGFFRSLALTLGAGLLASLLLALFFNPTIELMAERLRRPPREPGRLFVTLQGAYLVLLQPFLRVPFLALFTAGGLLTAAYGLYRTIGTDYLPELDEGAFILDYVTPPESTLDDTQSLLARIETILRSTPEVVAFSRRTGTQLGFFLTESNRGDFSVRLAGKRNRGIDQVIESVRTRILANVPGVEVEFSQVLQDLIGDLSGTPEPIVVNVFGPDQKTIEATARQIAAHIKTVPGLVDVRNGIVLSNPEEQIEIDETAAQRYGLSASDIRTVLRSVIEGTVATQVLVTDRLYPVRVRYPLEYRQRLDLLPEAALRTPDGGQVPLSSVASLRWLGETAELDRERLRPIVRVTARVEETDLGTAITQVQARVHSLALPAGVTVEYAGLYAEQQRAFHQLELVLVASIAAMFLVVIWEFGRITPALAVLLGALSCLAGSFVALDLTGLTLNISSFMGIIMVAGITAKNGILLLDHAEHEVDSGADPRTALTNAARIRLRPILMTSAATAAGLFPLALALGAGARIQQPLALAVIGGLAAAIVLSTPLAGGIYLLGTRAAVNKR